MIPTNVCIELLTIVLLTVVTAFAQSDRSPLTDAEKIADALHAGPAFITKDATLLDWPAAPGSEYRGPSQRLERMDLPAEYSRVSP